MCIAFLVDAECLATLQSDNLSATDSLDFLSLNVTVKLINKEPAVRTNRKFMARLPGRQPGNGGTTKPSNEEEVLYASPS